MSSRRATAPASQRDAEEAELQYVEAHRAWQSGEYFDAVAAMSEAVRLDSSQGKYHRVLASWLAENPSCAEATEEHFRTALSIDPTDRHAPTGLQKLLERESG